MAGTSKCTWPGRFLPAPPPVIQVVRKTSSAVRTQAGIKSLFLSLTEKYSNEAGCVSAPQSPTALVRALFLIQEHITRPALRPRASSHSHQSWPYLRPVVSHSDIATAHINFSICKQQADQVLTSGNTRFPEGSAPADPHTPSSLTQAP